MRAVAAPMGYKVPEFQSAFSMRLLGDGYIIVDQNGERFCNESGLEHYSMWMAVTAFDMESVRFSRIPSFVIFDEPTRLKGPITRAGHGANRGYQMERGQRGRNSQGLDRWRARTPSISAISSVSKTARVCTKPSNPIGAPAPLAADEKFGRAQKTLVGLDGSFTALRSGLVCSIRKAGRAETRAEKSSMRSGN